MRRSHWALIPLPLAALALAGCANEADKPSRALLEALDGIGLHGASYAAASLYGDTLRVSGVRGTDDAGRPLTVDEILANRSVASKEGWAAASVSANGLRGEAISADTLALVDVAVRSGGSGRPVSVGSYRAIGVKATLHGMPVEAREVSGSRRSDGTGEVAFASLSAAGGTWDGTVRIVAGPTPDTTAVSIPGLRSSRASLDLAAVLSGITPGQAMAYLLSPKADGLPDAAVRELRVGGTAAGLPAGVGAPDPSGFRDPRMRAVAEAVSGMVAKGMLGGDIRLAPGRPVALRGLLDAARGPGAYEALGTSIEIGRMPQDAARRLVTATSGRPASGPPEAPAPAGLK